VSTPLVHQFLRRSADRVPDREFVIQADARFSYRDIDMAAGALARQLVTCGVGLGDRVALLAHNSHFYVEAYYGILAAGAAVVPLNTASDPRMLEYFLADCGAEILVVGPRMQRLVQQAGDKLAGVRYVIAPDAQRLTAVTAERIPWQRSPCRDRPAWPDGVALTPEALASIVYTSGSTGRPRGVTLSHGNIVANVESIVSYLELNDRDRVLQVLPFYYVYGQSLLNTHTCVGGSVVIENRFQYVNVALDTLENERCTGFSGVPSTFAILLNRSNFAERKLADLRYVTQAGGSMSPALIRRLMAALPGKQIFIMYGATEASARLSYVPPDLLADAVGSIGRAIPGVELRVLRNDGSECADNEVGELVARGPNIMKGYWNAAEDSARVLSEHGYHTGDLARRDARGLLYIVGRKSDMIKVGGHRVSAKEIEDAILEHDAVHQVAVIGIPDEILGEEIKAFVVLREGAAVTAEALSGFLKKRVPGYKIPRHIEFRTALPVNPSGKIMKQTLRAETTAIVADELPDGSVNKS